MAGILSFLIAGGAALLADGDRAFQQRKYEDATALYVKAYEAAVAEKDDSVAAEAAAQAARGYLIREKMDDGRPWLGKAKGLARESDPNAWSRFLGVRGRFEWKDGQLETATKTFEAMYAYCVGRELFDRAVDAAHMVAITGTPEQQVVWAKRGIEAAEKGGFDGWLGPLWNNLGVTYQEKDDWKGALDCYRKARHYHWKVGNEVSKLAADWAVGMALRETGAVEESMTWMRPVLAWAERLYAEEPTEAHREWIGHACLDLALAQTALFRNDGKQERLEEAKRLLARARTILEAAKMEEWDPKRWEKLDRALAGLK